jgi:hypothetical protein
VFQQILNQTPAKLKKLKGENKLAGKIADVPA